MLEYEKDTDECDCVDMQDDRHRIPCSMTDMECERSDLCGKLIDVSIKLMTADRLLVIGKEI